MANNNREEIPVDILGDHGDTGLPRASQGSDDVALVGAYDGAREALPDFGASSATPSHMEQMDVEDGVLDSALTGGKTGLPKDFSGDDDDDDKFGDGKVVPFAAWPVAAFWAWLSQKHWRYRRTAIILGSIAATLMVIFLILFLLLLMLRDMTTDPFFLHVKGVCEKVCRPRCVCVSFLHFCGFVWAWFCLLTPPATRLLPQRRTTFRSRR
jgi:hypothetical protein